jgi:hypothetical protein
MDLCVDLRHQHLDRVAEPLPEGVERADVIAVSVRQRDPPDLSGGSRDQLLGGVQHGRVDECQAVVIDDEVRVHEVDPRERRDGHRSSGSSGWRLHSCHEPA